MSDLGSGVCVTADAVGLLGSPPHGALLAAPAWPACPPLWCRTAACSCGGAARSPGGVETGDGRAAVGAGDRPRALPDRLLPGACVERCRCVPPTGRSDLPEVPAAELCLQVDHVGGHRTPTDWSVQYRTGDASAGCRWWGTDPLPSRAAIADCRGAVGAGAATADDRLPQLWHGEPGAAAGSRPSCWHGMDTVVFTTEVLPRLAAAGVLVEVTGEPPDYRHTEAAPVVHVSATDGDDATGSTSASRSPSTARTSRSPCSSRRWPPATRTWCSPAARGSTSAVPSSTGCGADRGGAGAAGHRAPGPADQPLPGGAVGRAGGARGGGRAERAVGARRAGAARRRRHRAAGRRPPGSTRSCGPTSCRATSGSRSCGTPGSVACSPTTWGWARPCRPWRWCAGRRRPGS